MEINIILQQLLAEFSRMPLRLENIVLGLMTTFFGFEIIYSIAWKKEEDNILKILGFKIAHVFILAMIVKDYRNIATKLNESWVWLAGVATGINGQSPTKFIDDIINNGILMSKYYLENINVLNPTTYPNLLLWIIGVVVFMWIAIIIFVTYLEYGLLMGVGILFIPFLIFSKTKFIGEKIWGIIIGQNIKIFFIVVLFNFFSTYLNMDPGEGIEKNFAYMGGLIGLGFLIRKAPSIAMGMVGSTTGHDPSSAISSIGSTASLVMRSMGDTVQKMQSKLASPNGKTNTGHSPKKKSMDAFRG